MVVGSLLAGGAAGAAITIVIQAIDKTSKVFESVNKSMLAIGAGITAVGVAGAFAMKGLIKQAGAFEQTQIAFTTMLGSEEKALKLLKELADFAAKTPFTIPGIEASSKQLLAMGIELDDLLPTLKSLGDISAGLNVPLDRLALNFGQVAVQGKLTGRELRDFSVAGVPLVAELAKNLGVAESQIAEMVSAGDIGFELVEQAFTSMTSEGGVFFDLMDAQSKTLLGQISNIQDSFIKIARVMGEVFLPAAKWVAEHLAVIVGWMEEHPKLAKFATVTLGIATALALIGGPLMILIAILPAFAAGLGLVATGMTAVSIAGLPVWGVMLIIAAAIAALIAIGVVLYKNWDWIKEKGMGLYDFLKRLFAPQIALIMVAVKALKVAFRFLWDNGLGWVWEKMKDFYAWIKDKFLNVLEKAIGLIQSVGKFFGKVADFGERVGKSISSAGERVLGSRQDGGPINQTGLYKLHAGEFVVPPGGKGNVVINIENIYGLDPEEISRALSDELNNKLSL